MDKRFDINIDRVIAKVLQNEANNQEKEIFNDWLAATQDNQAIFEQLKLVWNNSKTHMKSVAEEELVDKIWKTADLDSKSRRKGNHRLLLILLKVAASIAFFVTLYFFCEKAPSTVPTEKIAYEAVIKKNSSGQRSMIHLTDGTVVWLNSESSLTYKKPFDDNLREVELVGEAYFEVAKDDKKPFIVNFNGSKVQVLGTSFNISSFQNNKADVISLAEGKIEITHGSNSQMLTAGWVAEIDPQTNQMASYEGNVEDNICWVDGIILFKEASYQQVFSKLERWYGVKIATSGTPKPGLKFNGSFKNEYLENILENLVLEDNLKYRIDGEQVFITFNQTPKL